MTEITTDLQLDIRTFGGLELTNRWGHVSENTGRPALTWLFLKYLFINRGIPVDMVELLDILWPGQEEASDAWFRVRLRRLREALIPLRLDGRNGLVQYSMGKYFLNPDCEINSDEQRFNALVELIRATPLEEPRGLELCMEALDIFRGEYMGERNLAPWLEPLREFYHREFVSLAHSTLSRTMILGDGRAMEKLCARASAIAPEAESLHKAVVGYLVDHKREVELIKYISRLSRGGHAPWLAE